jgi:Fe-S cluster assembly scaffold protein SufB
MATAEAPPETWLSHEQVRDLSHLLGDSAPMEEARRHSYRAFLEQPIEPDPLYRKYGYFGGVDLRALDPLQRGSGVTEPSAQADTLEVLHDGSGTHVRLPSVLRDAGVTVATYPQILQNLPAGAGAFGLTAGAPEIPDRLTALATTLVNRAVEIHIPDGTGLPVRLKDVTVLSEPHQVLSIHRRIRVGKGSRLLASEEVFTQGPPVGQRLHGSGTTVELYDDAQAAYLTVHAPDLQTISLSQRHATVGARARMKWVWGGFGGFRTRARSTTKLEGQASDVEDLQAFYGAGRQAYDSGVRIEHIGTDTHGQSITRGVFRDEARGMSRGLVRIEKDARRTLSYLSEHAMLLSRGARSDTIPILEILCRDVKATHSTSVAPVDPEKIFYLESRGIVADDAVRMIGEGFLSHVLDRAPFAELRDRLYPYLAARWDGRKLGWDDPVSPSLPPLEFTGAGAGTDWRFDAKLR